MFDVYYAQPQFCDTLVNAPFFFSNYNIYLFIFVCSKCLCLWGANTHASAEVGGGHPVFCSITSPFSGKNLSLNWELNWWPTSPSAPPLHLQQAYSHEVLIHMSSKDLSQVLHVCEISPLSTEPSPVT